MRKRANPCLPNAPSDRSGSPTHFLGTPAIFKVRGAGVDGPRVDRRSVTVIIVVVVGFIGLAFVLPGSALTFAIFLGLMVLVGLGGREVIRRSRD